jgi:hypothetical protein
MKVLAIFCYIVDKKNQTQSFSLLLILKIFPVTRFKDPKAAFLTHWKYLQEAAFDFVKSYRKPPETS